MADLEAKIAELNVLVQRKAENDELHLAATKLSALDELSKGFQGDLKSHKDEQLKLRTKVDLFETKMAYSSKAIAELQSKLDLYRSRPLAPEASATITAGTGLAPQKVPNGRRPSRNCLLEPFMGQFLTEDSWLDTKSAIEKLGRSLGEVQSELDVLRDLKKKYIAFEKLISGKLDAKTFEDYRRELDPEELFCRMEKRFIERTELQTAVTKLKSRIRILEEAVAHEEATSADPAAGGNAMLAKKQLGGWSCASCQKELLNMEASKPSYYPWARLPKKTKEAVERVAKVRQLERRKHRWDMGSRRCCRCSSRR